MNEMQAHGLLIPVGSKPFEVWIDKNNSLAELQDLVNGNVDVLSVLGNGVDLWVNEEGLINGSKPNRAIYATKHMEEVGYLDQLTFGHPVKEGELYSLITASNRINISFRMSTPPATSMRNLRSPSPRSLQKPGRAR